MLISALSFSWALAYDFIDNGIYYTIISAPDKKVEVSAPKQKTEYAGDFVIPAQVVNNGTTYTVTQIGKEAFLNTKITSLQMPNTL